MVIELRTKTLKIHLWHLNKNYANLQTIKKTHPAQFIFQKIILKPLQKDSRSKKQ